MKKAIVYALVLVSYNPNRPTIMSADSSSYGLGAELKQRQFDSSWRSVVFALRALTDIERCYAQIEETFALTWACQKLFDFLIGAQCFMLQTYRNPLTLLLYLQRALSEVPPLIQRFRIRLMRFDFVIENILGNMLHFADTPSRFP